MCLSTAYKNKIDPENVLMKNVASVSYINGHVILTDLMERKLTVEGELEVASLTDGYVIIKQDQ